MMAAQLAKVGGAACRCLQQSAASGNNVSWVVELVPAETQEYSEAFRNSSRSASSSAFSLVDDMLGSLHKAPAVSLVSPSNGRITIPLAGWQVEVNRSSCAGQLAGFPSGPTVRQESRYVVCLRASPSPNIYAVVVRSFSLLNRAAARTTGKHVRLLLWVCIFEGAEELVAAL